QPAPRQTGPVHRAQRLDGSMDVIHRLDDVERSRDLPATRTRVLRLSSAACSSPPDPQPQTHAPAAASPRPGSGVHRPNRGSDATGPPRCPGVHGHRPRTRRVPKIVRFRTYAPEVLVPVTNAGCGRHVSGVMSLWKLRVGVESY